MKISKTKTRNNESTMIINIGDQIVKNVKEYVYLGHAAKEKHIPINQKSMSFMSI